MPYCYLTPNERLSRLRSINQLQARLATTGDPLVRENVERVIRIHRVVLERGRVPIMPGVTKR